MRSRCEPHPRFEIRASWSCSGWPKDRCYHVTGSNQSNDDLKRLVDQTMDRWGRIDVLGNSAGHGPRAPLLDISDDDWHRGMEVYFLNVVRPTRLVAPIMVKQKSGVIINISTAWAFEPSPMFPTSSGAGILRQDLCGP